MCRPRTARTPCRNGKSCEIEPNEKCVLPKALNAKVQNPCEALCLRPIKGDAVHRAEHRPKVLRISTQTLRLHRHLCTRKLRCVTAADKSRDILRARTAVTLLCAAIEKRRTFRPTPEIESTNALGSAEFMRRKGKGIHLQRIHIE